MANPACNELGLGLRVYRGICREVVGLGLRVRFVGVSEVKLSVVVGVSIMVSRL